MSRERVLAALAFAAASAIVGASLWPGVDASDLPAVVGFIIAAYVALDRAFAGGNEIALVRIGFDRWDGLYLALALLTPLVWVIAQGVPAFRQDWYLSPLGSQFGSELWQTLSAWQTAELGYATPQAGFHPLLLVWGVLAFAVGSKAAVIIFIVAVLAGAAFFARRAIAMLIGADGAPAVLGGALFAFSAPALNKFVAGHTLHLADHALLAVSVILACRSIASSGRARTANQIGLALVIALAAPQPQGFILCAAATLVIALASRSTAPLGPLAIAIALQLPTALAAALSPGEAYTTKRAVIDWQFAQSARPSQLVSLGGYLARYYEHASVLPLRQVAALVTALAVLGITRLRGTAGAIAFAGFASTFLIMGLYGPLASQLAFAYQSLSAASLFREAYDFAPLLAFAVALGAAQCFEIWSRRYAWRAAGAAGLLVALTIAPTVLVAARLVPTSGTPSEVRALAALPGDGRIFWLPGIYPLTTGDGRGEGYDPLMRSAGAHAVVYAFQPIPIEALTYTLLGIDAKRAAPLLARLGCSYIAVDREAGEVPKIPGALGTDRALAGARSFPAVPFSDPRFEIYALAPAAQIEALGVTARTGALDPNDPAPGDSVMLFDDPQNAIALRRSGVADLAWNVFTPSTQAANPSYGTVLGRHVWARYSEYAFSPSVNGVIAEGAQFELPPGVLVADWRTAPTINGVVSRMQSDIAVPDPAHLAVAGPALYVGERSGPALIARRVAARPQGRIVYTRDSPTKFSAAIVGGAVHALVLRERYDAGWRLSGIPSAIHFSADGWANGWITELQEGAHVTIEYGPQKAIALAESLAALGWMLLLGALVWKGARR